MFYYSKTVADTDAFSFDLNEIKENKKKTSFYYGAAIIIANAVCSKTGFTETESSLRPICSFQKKNQMFEN